MRVTKDYHYLTRLVDFGGISHWRVWCYPCLGRMFQYTTGDDAFAFSVEVISYSQFACALCSQKYKAPPGLRPAYKMRAVTYVIRASYPEWDMTA